MGGAAGGGAASGEGGGSRLAALLARFAPGRLNDMPVQRGLLDRPLREEALKPLPTLI